MLLQLRFVYDFWFSPGFNFAYDYEYDCDYVAR